MASKLDTFPYIFLFLLILSFFSHVLAINSTTLNTNASHEAICNSTPYPADCRATLPLNQSGTIHDYSRFFIKTSLKIANQFLSLLNSFLKNRRPPQPEPTIRALQDCHLLTELTLETLSKTYQAINSTNTLDFFEADDLQTLLSAALTNQETCLVGLQEVTSAASVRNALLAPVSNGTKLYSISLALFKHGWVDKDDDDDDDDDEDDDDDDIVLLSTMRRKMLQRTADPGGVLVSQMMVVDKNGTGNFTTISEAVNAAPNNTVNGSSNSTTYYGIYIVRGVYEEYVSIPSNKRNLMLIGDGINQTVITGNRSVVDGWTTFNSATFAVAGQGFVAINITFRNTAGAIKQQAVALRNNADLSAFHGCSFEGYQDTLYTHSLRQFYRDCDIYGTIDFIFGNAAVVIQNCNIYPRLPLRNQFNAITAQGRTDPNQNTGTSIHNCNVRAASDLATSNSTTRTYLGRPWQEYSRTVYMQSSMDSVIDPAGWREWSENFALSTLYYAEFNNSGPGSNTSSRVTWPGYRVISVTDAVIFTVSNFIVGDAWLTASTGVPYTAGLL